MTSSLAQQLKAIQQEDRLVRGVPAGQTKRPSFLFDEKEAADYDNESIFALGLEGFQDLCKEDSTLRSYQERILNARLINADLSLMTKKEKKEVDDEVAAFLVLLSAHFEKKAAHKVMEWMVRKWRVNETNVDALMICILPHHDTLAFVRMVQIIYFTSSSRWSFLFDKVKQGGSSISRKLIAQRCTVDQAILGRVIRGYSDLQQHIKVHPDYKYASLYISFVSFLMLEILANTRKLSESETIVMYQRLEVLIHDGAREEALVGAMMIFMEFCERASLSDAAVAYFIRKIVKKCTSAIGQHVILTIARTVEAGFASVIEPQIALSVASLTIDHWEDSLASYKHDKFVTVLLDALSQIEGSKELISKLQSLACSNS